MDSIIQIVFEKYTLKDFNREFPDHDTCLEWIKNYRFPDGIYCKKCLKITNHHKITKRSCYKCDKCGHEVYPTAGTIFHKSTTPLNKWFEAIFWMATSRYGHTAKELQRRSGVTYKTAWRMLKRINTIFDNGEIPLEIDIDDIDFGGSKKPNHSIR